MLLTKNNSSKYLSIAKNIAEMSGYKSKDLKLANDGIHKLVLNNIKFGNINYPDFILFYMNNEMEQAKKHRINYLKRSSNIKGNWKKDMMSRNNLSRRIIWGSDLN